MDRLRLKKASLGLLYLIFGSANAFAMDWPLLSLNKTDAHIKITGSNGFAVKGCRNLLQDCTGIIICPNCAPSPPNAATITISNTSNVTAQGLSFSSPYPNFSTYVAQTGSCGSGTFNLSAGTSCTATFSTTATIPTFPGFTTTLTLAGTNISATTIPFQYFENG